MELVVKDLHELRGSLQKFRYFQRSDRFLVFFDINNFDNILFGLVQGRKVDLERFKKRVVLSVEF